MKTWGGNSRISSILLSVSGWVRANQSRFRSKPNSFCRRLASRPSGFWVGRITVIRLSLRCRTAQEVPAANSYSVLRAASAPLFSPPCTFPAIQTMAGRLAAIRRARSAGIPRGSRRPRISAAISSRTPCRTCRLLDTTAYGSGWPSTLAPIVPATTRSDAWSTALR